MLVAALLAAASACGGGDAGTTTAPPPSTGASPEVTAGLTNPQAPLPLRREVTTVAGTPLDLSALAGQPTAFWFWAPG